MSRVRTEATEEWCIKYSEQINLNEISGLKDQTRGVYGFFILDSGKSECGRPFQVLCKRLKLI